MAIDRFFTKPPQAVDGTVAFAIDVNGISDEASLAFTKVATELDGQVSSISAWTTLAQRWAEEAEDVEVTTGAYSAYHWAQKADELGADQVALAAAQVALAADQVAIAQEWSENPEDVEVTPGSYSALHWAAKAANIVALVPEGALDDFTTSLTSTWSSTKIDSEITLAGIKDYQEFSSSGIWTKPEGANFIYVECIAGGAGGANTTAASAGFCGGCGGEFISKLILANIVGPTVNVTVGSGGPGCANGSSAVGQDGGSSSFGSLVVTTTTRGGFTGSTTNLVAPLRLGGAYSFMSPGNYGITRLNDSCGGAGLISRPFTDCINGGGGGGGCSGVACGIGGISVNAGNGGAGSPLPNTKGGNGTAPGGGGGASINNGGGGDGADGIVRVWAW